MSKWKMAPCISITFRSITKATTCVKLSMESGLDSVLWLPSVYKVWYKSYGAAQCTGTVMDYELLYRWCVFRRTYDLGKLCSDHFFTNAAWECMHFTRQTSFQTILMFFWRRGTYNFSLGLTMYPVRLIYTMHCYVNKSSWCTQFSLKIRYFFTLLKTKSPGNKPLQGVLHLTS